MSPILPDVDESTMAVFPTGKPREQPLETVICRHCKRSVMKQTAPEHIRGCLRAKQEKARKKKEARDANRAKERGEKEGVGTTAEDDAGSTAGAGAGTGEGGGEDGPSGTMKGQKSAKKSHAVKGMAEDGSKKGKKRKTDVTAGAEDEKDGKEPKKKKKKDEPKVKTSKPKGPVDVEKQCGVTLPNGGQCARSLTCKSHSMGAKRAVPGRSLPYDMLLQAHQKQNQARQQSKSFFVIYEPEAETNSPTNENRGSHRCQRPTTRRHGKRRPNRLRRRTRCSHGRYLTLTSQTTCHTNININQKEIPIRTYQGNAISCFGWCSWWWTILNRW